MRNLANHLPESSGFDLKHLLVEPGKTISLRKDFDPKYTGAFKGKEEALAELKLNVERLAKRTRRSLRPEIPTPCCWCSKPWMPQEGWDDQARDVGVNPQGCEVYSFKSSVP